MATQQPRLVNKQFNSPIGLYSEQNVREVLDRETQILANGAVGVNFYNPSAGKSQNLQNSAVLRMLEEEENRQRNGHHPSNDYAPKSLRENVSWPPPQYEIKNKIQGVFKDTVTPGVKRVAWPPQYEGAESEATEQAAVQSQGGGHSASLSNPLNRASAAPAAAAAAAPAYAAPNHQQQQQLQQQPHHHHHQTAPGSPLHVQIGGPSPIVQSPLSPNTTPLGFRPQTPTNKQWAPVHSPTRVAPQPFYQAPQAQPQQYQPPQQQYQPAPQQYPAPSQQYQAPAQQYQVPVQQYQPPQQQYQPPQQQYQAPQQQYQAPQQQYQPPQEYQIPVQQYQAPTPAQPQQYQAPPQSFNQQPQAQPAVARSATPVAPVAAPQQKQVEPPPSTITLRPQAPVSQPPQPVYTSQPATATLKGGRNLKGDLKWPSEDVKKQSEAEMLRLQGSTNMPSGKHLRGDLKWPPEDVRQRMLEERIHQEEIARGPALRPPKNLKDYTGFYAQHQLNDTYPRYVIPPGTQFFRPV